jgi:hypothetical protein
MKTLLREPLLHFLLLGAVLFIAYKLIAAPGTDGAPGRITVTVGQIQHLAAGFAQTWDRPPTDSELRGLIDDWVREEIATREAIAMGLDKDDTVIRRRLRQKLEFVSEDIAAQTKPTEADLTAYLHAHPESFRVEPRITFSQVYLDPAKHGAHIARDAAKLLAGLQQSGRKVDSSALGDPFLLGHTFQSASTSDVAKQFGDGFAEKLSVLSIGQWQGPVESSYGMHLVLVSERSEAQLPALSDVREAVRTEWENARRLEGSEKFYGELRKRYTVTVEAAK